MGLATSVMYVGLFVVTLLLFTGLMFSFDDYIKGTEMAAMENQKSRAEKARTEIDITRVRYNTSYTPALVSAFVMDTGRSVLETNCSDVFVNGSWIDRDEITYTLMNVTNDPLLWNPDETLKTEFQLDLAANTEHNFTFVTCNGIRQTVKFNATICGDGICMPGEYCPIDNISCSDEICSDPTCLDGCGSEIIAGIDEGECEGSTGCNTDDCWCQGGGCCGKVNSACIDNEDCCSGICIGFTCQP